MSNNRRKVIKPYNLRLEKTCDYCPEQYDVYYGPRRVGYIRLRWGVLRVDFLPNGKLEDNETLIVVDFDDMLKGSFSNELERQEHLNNARNKLAYRLTKGK